MKQLILVCLVLLTFCSCAKNYPQMVKDRVEQYQKEGKYVLGQSNDSTGKEHYIVYIDEKQIVVDTLGDSLQVFPLGKMEYMKLRANVPSSSSKFEYKAFDTNCSYDVKCDLKKKLLSVIDASDSLGMNSYEVKFQDIKCLGKSSLFIGNNSEKLFFFFDKPKKIYGAYADVKIDENKNTLDLTYQNALGMLDIFGLDQTLSDYTCKYVSKLSWTGEVVEIPTSLTIKDVYQIPTSAFGTDKLNEYESKLLAAMGIGDSKLSNSIYLGTEAGHEYYIQERNLDKLDEGDAPHRYITRDGIVWIDLNKLAIKYDDEAYLCYGEIREAKLFHGRVYIIFDSHYFNGGANYDIFTGVSFVDLTSKAYIRIDNCADAHFEGNTIRYNKPDLMNPNASCTAEYQWRDHWLVYSMQDCYISGILGYFSK